MKICLISLVLSEQSNLYVLKEMAGSKGNLIFSIVQPVMCNNF